MTQVESGYVQPIDARPCVVCGEHTTRRITTFKPNGRVHYRTFRCDDFDACAERRNAGHRRPL